MLILAICAGSHSRLAVGEKYLLRKNHCSQKMFFSLHNTHAAEIRIPVRVVLNNFLNIYGPLVSYRFLLPAA